jgi:hypothetical protein
MGARPVNIENVSLWANILAAKIEYEEANKKRKEKKITA